MIEKVPKEELNALFKEIYSFNENNNYPQESQKLNPAFIFYGYKFKAILNKGILNSNKIPVFIKDFEVKYFENQPKKVHTGYSLENKYRIFFDIEENLLNENDLNNEIVNGFELLNSLIENFSDKILSNINLKSEKIVHPYTYFYTENILEYSFNLFIADKTSKFKIYLEEDLLTSESISKWIILNPTSQEREKIRKLKKKLTANLNIISNPIDINNRKQTFDNLDFKIKIT